MAVFSNFLQTLNAYHYGVLDFHANHVGSANTQETARDRRRLSYFLSD